MFSAPMIRALLAGRKTMTRRPITKLEIHLPGTVSSETLGIPSHLQEKLGRLVAKPGNYVATMNPQGAVSIEIDGKSLGIKPGEFDFLCPYLSGPVETTIQKLDNRSRWKIVGRPQNLWVREAVERKDFAAVYVADGAPVLGAGRWEWKTRTLSPIYMPRAFARFEIEPSAVYVEKLTAISREDAIAEGAFFTDYGKTNHGGLPEHQDFLPGWSMVKTTKSDECLSSPIGAFGNYYNELHGGPNWNLKAQPHPFEAAPFVWAIAFTPHRIVPHA